MVVSSARSGTTLDRDWHHSFIFNEDTIHFNEDTIHSSYIILVLLRYASPGPSLARLSFSWKSCSWADSIAISSLPLLGPH